MKNLNSKSALVVLLVLSVIFLSPVSQGLAEKGFVFENLTEEVGRGFGSTWNRYTWSMGVDEHLYVGTWSNQTDWPAMLAAIASGELADVFNSEENPLAFIGFVASDGGEIWRFEGDQSWTRVAKAPPEVTGFRKMLKYQERLYAGTANNQEGAELWVKEVDPLSTTGETWSALDPPWAPENSSIRALCTFSGSGDDDEKLYVGTENNVSGGELWTFDGVNWDHIWTFDVHSVAEIAVFEDVLYVGTWTFQFDFLGGTPSDTFQLFKSEDGVNFQNVKPEFDGREDLSNVGVMTLINFDGRLYLGTVNYIDGFTLLASRDPSDVDSWEVLTTDGFGDPDNAYFWSAVVVNDILVAGTFDSGITGGFYPVIPMDGRAKVLYTQDGTNFATLVDDGFGVPFTYGVRCMINFNDHLLFGTATNILIPDFQSSLYDSLQIEQVIATILNSQDPSYQQLIPFLLDGLLSLYSAPSDGPFIGTQVWAIPLGKPSKKKAN